MSAAASLVAIVVLVALAFDYTNGFHDAANAIATAVSTRALTPRVALALAAVDNLSGRFIATRSPQTVAAGSSTRRRARTGCRRRSRALSGAIVWNLVTWYFGLPSSSSHALIGGPGRRGLAAADDGAVEERRRQGRHPDGASRRSSASVSAYLLMLAILWVFRRRNPRRVSGASGTPRSRRRPPWPSATASRTRRRRWASSSSPFIVRRVPRRRDDPALGDRRAATGDLARHLRRRLADHADPRPTDHRAGPAPRLRGRDDGGERPLRDRVRLRRAGLDDAHHHVVDHGRRCDPPAVRGPLGGPPATSWPSSSVPFDRSRSAALVAAACSAVARPLLE